MQPTTGNASKLLGPASRNSNHHPRHPRHPSQGAPHRRDEVTDPGSSLCCLPIYHLGKSLHRWVSRRGSIRKSVATGQQSTNYRAEVYALLAAAQTLNQEVRLPTNTVFLTDCWSILQSLQSSGRDQTFSNIRQELSLLKNKTSVTLQWIPSNCRVGGNEEADRLSKMGSKLEQTAHPISYSEAKTILRNNFRTNWQHRIDNGTEEDSIQQLDRAAQVTISRPRTEHFQLLPDLHRLKNFPFRQMSPTTSCSPAQPLTLWDARRGPVQCMPTGSFGDRLRHCDRLSTLPCKLDWRSSMARNAEKEEEDITSIWQVQTIYSLTVWLFYLCNKQLTYHYIYLTYKSII